MSLLISIISSIILTALGILYTIRYSSVYHVKKSKRAREKYCVSEKLEFMSKFGYSDSARIILTKSSIKNAMGFLDISLNKGPEEIYLNRYALINSCIHSVIAPGKLMLKNEKSWQENAPSNEFEDFYIFSKRLDKIPINLIPNKIRRRVTDSIVIEQQFKYPSDYNGPRKKKRLLIFAKNIGLIYAETEFVNGNIDKYQLNKFKVKDGRNYWLPINKVGNYWIYDIIYDFGPNKLNMLG